MTSVPRRFKASQAPPEAETGDLPPKGEGEEATPQQRARDALVLPERVVPVPRYLLRYWHGLLSPPELMLAIGVRQAAFLPKETAESVKTTPLRLSAVGRWAGFTPARASDLLNKSSNPYLGWFFQRQAGAAARGPAPRGVESRFEVQIGIPLSPVHQQILHRLAADQYIIWHARNPQGSAAQFLSHLEQRVGGAAFLDGLVEPGEPGPEPESPARQSLARQPLAQLLSRWFGQLSPEERYLCQALEARIVQPKNSAVLTHYFVDRWLPELSSLEAVLLMLCRARLRGEEPVGQLHFADVYAFARFARVDNRTAKKMIAALAQGQGALANFIRAETTARGVTLAVQRQDPIHPADLPRYQAALHLLAGGEPLEALPGARPGRTAKSKYTPARYALEIDDGDLHNVDTRSALTIDPDDISLPDPLQTIVSLPAKPDHLSSHNVDNGPANHAAQKDKMLSPGSQKTDPLIGLESVSRKNRESSKQPLLNPTTSDAPEITGVVVVNDWDITRILQLAGLSSHADAQKMLAVIQARNEAGEQFIARLIWAYERKTTSEKQGIDFPELYAVRHYRESPPSAYLQLAQQPPDALADGMAFYGSLREDQRQLLKPAWQRGMAGLIEELCAALYEQADADQALEEDPVSEG